MRIILFCLLSVSSFVCKKQSVQIVEPMANNTLMVSMETFACRGYCPVYRLWFRNSGEASYEGLRFVEKTGKYDFKISATELADLKKLLQAANIGQYEKDIPTNIADAQGVEITKYDGDAFVVARGSADRPASLLALEDKMKSLAEAYGFKVKEGVNPNELPATKKELLVKLKPEVNAGNWMLNYESLKVKLVRRVSAENIWVVAYDPAEIAEKALIDLFKANKDVLEAQPNRTTEERH